MKSADTEQIQVGNREALCPDVATSCGARYPMAVLRKSISHSFSHIKPGDSSSVTNTHKGIASLVIFVFCTILNASTASSQALPRGELVDALPVQYDESVICSLYVNKKKKVEAVLARVDGAKHTGKPFWTLKTVKKQIQVLTQNLKTLKGSKSKADVKKAKKLNNEKKALAKARAQLVECAAGGASDPQERLVRFAHVKKIIEKQCMNCHGVLGWSNEESFFVDSGRAVPGKLEASSLYTFLSNNPEGFQPAYMPKGTAALKPLDILLLGHWVQDLEKSGVKPTPKPNPIDPEGQAL